ncbi:MAG: polysaccharide deacetylase family protein [Bryobacteraceae bacterium]|jgi:peptidoglycan/xylan/chitin deacetylase (PgdA/CDA1 family)
MASELHGVRITTSWDDGHPLDLRVAEKLASRGMAGTFYVPTRYEAVPRMSVSEIREIRAMGMEVGAHTVTHPRLSQLSDGMAYQEMKEGREELEQMLGEPVTSFCFPEGKFRRGHDILARRAGFTLARTTLAFRVDGRFDPLSMPVTLQLYPHARAVLARHAVVEGNIAGLLSWAGRFGAEAEPARLAARAVEHAGRRGGVVHIWGHSWEVEAKGLWNMLEHVLNAVANRPGAAYVTNAGTIQPC